MTASLSSSFGNTSRTIKKNGSGFRSEKKTLNYVAALLAAGHEVVSGKELKENGVVTRLALGAAIEIELRIAKNDDKFKITDLPEF